MADLQNRLQEASKEELSQVLVAVCGHATTRDHVESVLDYLDDKKKTATEAATNRRTRRQSTRASSEASQGSNQAVPKTVKRTIKMCKLCEKPYIEKENLSKSCFSHPGHWLLECEKDDHVWFEDLDKATEEFTSNPHALRIMSCCNAEKGFSKGCVNGKHVAMVVEAQSEASKSAEESSSDN
ncbi:hypothetical protein CORC01_04894 [Colletotrichum orchidophilum]|uniref:C2H2-type domain-containing protein n=1 Tax=Colletotrichum orchidophilum TaxID=1209926 RepID=A0A1G4BEF4_9PEZI|nr:uncharacterized protein CORC01_04894 [Colletotrichum orchidophilum]OHE99758.1 hypothetical protein CORC01_04894 [Colletotrichum orchidophilum]